MIASTSHRWNAAGLLTAAGLLAASPAAAGHEPPPWQAMPGKTGDGGTAHAGATTTLTPAGCLGAMRIGPQPRAVLARAAEGGDPLTEALDGGSVVIWVLGGSDIGRSMGAADLACLGWTLENAADGGRVRWTNGDGVTYRLWLTGTRAIDAHRFCREYVAQARIDGVGKRLVGSACREPDGAWRVVN